MKTVQVKAIIKYNQMDGQQVLYYKTPLRVLKMTNKKQVTRMSVSPYNSNFKGMRTRWSRDRETIIVYEDEQPLLNGEPIKLDDMVPFPMSEEEIKSFDVGTPTLVRKLNMNVSGEAVKILRKQGWTIAAIAKSLECSVSTVLRKSA